MHFASVATVVREGDVARFPAIRAIIQAVRAQPDLILTFADGTVFLAGAILFRLVTQGADNWTGHGDLPENCT
jgi:hypothetical protein